MLQEKLISEFGKNKNDGLWLDAIALTTDHLNNL